MKSTIIITILLLLPVSVAASSSIENINDQSVKNSLNIISNTGGNTSGQQAQTDDGNSSVRIKIESSVNGEKVIDEDLQESSKGSVEVKVKSEVVSGTDKELTVETDKEVVIEGEKKIDSQEKTVVPSGQSKESSRADSDGGAIGVSSINNTNNSENIETEKELVELDGAETAPSDFDAASSEDGDEDVAVCVYNTGCDEEEGIGSTEEDENKDSNIIKIIMNYFVNIFSKLIKVFT